LHPQVRAYPLILDQLRGLRNLHVRPLSNPSPLLPT
jgi:hypothetical protein